MNLEHICNNVIDIARNVKKYIQTERMTLSENDILTKGIHNFVTYVDTNAEKKLVEGLAKILPKAGFITEENTIQENIKDYTWIIDPLDGTTNFIHGLPCYSISIGLMYNSEIVLGMVYELNKDECFYAWEQSKAYLNGKPIAVSTADNIEDSIFSTGFPYKGSKIDLDKYLALFKHILVTSHGIRRFGSAAVDLAYVACGRFEGYYELGLNPWDVAAGSFIVKQAGGMVSDFYKNNDFLFGKQIIACNKNIYTELSNTIQQYLND